MPPQRSGNGIEYAWGFSKKVYRKRRLERNRRSAKNIMEDIQHSFSQLTPETCLRFMRRVRRYMWAYRQKDASTHSLIEKFVKLHKCHRNVLDQESAFLNSAIEAQQATIDSLNAEIEIEKAEAQSFAKINDSHD